MGQIGIVMFLVGLTGILIVMGKWIYEDQGLEGIALYTSGIVIAIGMFLTAAGGNH